MDNSREAYNILTFILWKEYYYWKFRVLERINNSSEIMKARNYRIVSLVCFLMSGLVAFGQGKIAASIELDTLQKIVGLVMIGGGMFLGYMTMRMANKLAEQEIKFNAKIDTMKQEFNQKIDNMEEKLTLRWDTRIKDVEVKMATHHDINGLKQIILLQHENTVQATSNLKEQLTLAAKIYREDKNG